MKIEYQVNCENLRKDEILEPFDLIINEEFIKAFCKCEECQKVFGKIKKHVEAVE